MASRDWSSGRPPGKTESNAIIQAFPELLDELNHLKADANGSKTNQSMADTTDYLKAMQMNYVDRMPHSKENQSFLLD